MSDASALGHLKVLEVGQLLAGPFAGTLLGYFGAEVIKIEPPGKGDPIRYWRELDANGTGYWWRSLARNKKSVTANLRTEAGREIVRRLAQDADVLIENFKPGTMEKWGLGPDDLKATNPDLIYARISGYGQTGPYHTKPGYASVTEAFSGFRHLNGVPGEVPVRPNLSLGDSVAGLHATLGILVALLARHSTALSAKPALGTAVRGQVVDVALYEAMFNLMEGVVPEFTEAGLVRQPSGSTLTGIVPTNTYPCQDHKYVVIGGNGDSIFVRLMRAIGRVDLADDQRLAQNPGRVAHQTLIDEAIGSWALAHTAAEVIAALEAAEVPVGLIYDVADAQADPQYQAREMFEEVAVGASRMTIPAMAPKLSATPGRTRWAGPEVGVDTEQVLADAGYSRDEINTLRESGDI